MAYPRFQIARNFKYSRKTSAGPALSSSWANVDTATDLTLAAQVGDVIEVGLGVPWANQSDYGLIDVATIVSGSVVNYFGGGSGTGSGDGIMGASESNFGAYTFKFGMAWLTLGAGDLSSGTVTLRVRARNAGGGKALNISANDPLFFTAKNLGPMDPN